MKKSKHRFRRTVAVMRWVNAVATNCINPKKGVLRRLLSGAMALVMLIATVSIPPSVHAAGGWDEVNHRRDVTCKICNGSGTRSEPCSPTVPDARCTLCFGTAVLTTYTCSGCGIDRAAPNCGPDCEVYINGHGWESKNYKCFKCNGLGESYKQCPYCHGTGIRNTSCPTTEYQYDTTVPTISLAKTIDANNAAYAGQDVTVTATASDNLSGVNQYKFDSGAWQSSNKIVIPSNAGTVNVTCVVKDNAGNISATQSIAVKTIQPQSPLNIAPVTPPTYGDSFTLSATGGSTSNPIVWSIVSGNATISGNRVTTTGIGDIVIKAVMPGNANYYDAEATTTVVVAQKALTVSGSLSAQNKVYDGDKMAQLTGDLALEGIINGDNVTLSSVSAQFASADVGNNKAITVSPFTLNGADAGNYTLTQPTLTGYKANITAKNLTVTDTAVNDKTYDGSTIATYTTAPKLVGIVGSDDVTLSGGTPSFKTASKGTDKELTLVPFALDGVKKGNYTLTQPMLGTADITALQVTVADVAAKDKTYNGTTDAEFAGTPKLVGVRPGDDVSLVNGKPSFDSKNVGTSKTISYTAFVLNGTDAENYAIVQPNATTANVTPKALTTKPITVQDKQYDATTAATIETELEGVVSGDTVALSAGKAEFDTADVGSDKAVAVAPFALSGTDAGNYTFTQPVLTGYKANITAKNLTVTDTAVNDKTYDGSTIATYTTAPKLVGIVGSDDVTLSGGTPSFKTAGKGADKELTLVPFALSGTKKGNYTLTQPVLGTADITALQVTVTDVAAKDKTYDGTTDAEFAGTPKLVGIKPGDDVSLVNGVPSFDNKNVGTGKTISYTAFALSGTDAENYAIVQPGTTTANITPKALTTKPITVKDKQYDATTAATIETELEGVVSGDTVTLDFGKAEFDTADVGSDKSVTVDPFTLSGKDAGNYTLTQPALTVKGKITPKPISITPDAKSKVFGDSDPSFTYTHGSLIGGDTITGELKRKPGEDAGKYDYDISALTAGDNYALEVDAAAQFIINKAPGKASLAVTKSTTAPIDVILSASVSGADGQVEFFILGEKVNTVKVENGLAIATYKPLSVGNYTATCKLVDSKNYSDTTSGKVDFTVSNSELYPPLPPPSIPNTIVPNRPIIADTNKATSKKEEVSSAPVLRQPNIEVKDIEAIESEPEEGYPLTIPDPFWVNSITQEAIKDIPEQQHTPSLIVVDITEGIDMTAYSSMLSEQNIQKDVIGVYSAKLLLDGFEIEPHQTVEVKIPFTGKLAEYKDHDVYRMTDTLKNVQVKSISAEAITFETDNLGYFAVLGESTKAEAIGVIDSGMNWWSFALWSLFGLACAGIIWFLLILLWRRKREKEEEPA